MPAASSSSTRCACALLPWRAKSAANKPSALANKAAFERPFSWAPEAGPPDLNCWRTARQDVTFDQSCPRLSGVVMIKDLSVKYRLYFGFGSIVAIILLLLALAYNSFARLSEASGWDRHTLEVLLEADKVSIDVLNIQSEERGYI